MANQLKSKYTRTAVQWHVEPVDAAKFKPMLTVSIKEPTFLIDQRRDRYWKLNTDTGSLIRKEI